jgi:hypothetical protein
LVATAGSSGFGAGLVPHPATKANNSKDIDMER